MIHNSRSREMLYNNENQSRVTQFVDWFNTIVNGEKSVKLCDSRLKFMRGIMDHTIVYFKKCSHNLSRF